MEPLPKECPDIEKCEEKVSEDAFEIFCNNAWQYCDYLSEETENLIKASSKLPREWKKEMK